MRSDRLAVSRVGFTLIELLVVISIIALLIGILIPALSAARETARGAACLSNQKQVGIAIHAYASEYKNSIPFGPRTTYDFPFDPDAVTDAFYQQTGLIGSQISLDSGAPMAHGLLLPSHLADTPEALFCPGTDYDQDAAGEIARFGNERAISSYFYRHGSNNPNAKTDLDDLGENPAGEPIDALLMDQQFLVADIPALVSLRIYNRTNHNQQVANTLFRDGHASPLNNANGDYTADVGNAFQDAPDIFQANFEKADVPGS